MAAPAFGAIDILVLGGDWEPQGGSPSLAYTRATASGSDGDIIAEVNHNAIESGTVSYIYTGAETGFAAALLAATAQPGRLKDTNTLFITSTAIDYSPCAEGKRPIVTFTFRDGPTAAPATPYWYASALSLPTYVAANIDVPTLATVTEGGAEVQTTDWSIACQLGEDLDKTGDFLNGDAYQGEETVNFTYTGLPSSVAMAGWIQTAGPGSNAGGVVANTGYDTYSYTFVRAVTRST